MVALCAALPLAHVALLAGTRIDPPRVELPPEASGRSWVRTRAGVREVYLQGTPEQIGAENARRLREPMLAGERALWGDFERFVPWWVVRVGIEDYSRLRYRHVDADVPAPRRRELAAQALAFAPDPFASRMPTYQRMLFLSALYDIALPLEHSPLIGCTSFALPGAGGHELVARAFDFEADDSLDRDKVVYLVRERGAIPFASVAWPGFVGVVTGMNAEGVVMVVHGGRAREPDALGMPVAFSLREALSHGRTAAEAVAILEAQPVMVSHIVFVADGSGEADVVERAPGVPATVRSAHGAAWVTNTFEGPLANDPKNVRVRATTTSEARGARIDALLRSAPANATPADALAMLRDHTCAGDPGCAMGDRRAIDALIATHGIVADATAHELWVSSGPHLAGAFVEVDLDRVFSPGYDPGGDTGVATLPADPILSDGRYAAALASRARAVGLAQ
ncbi:MAG: C45 family autoproteolytic acyltransferase/hydrolase [Polyangiaceae bacterium]